MSPASSAALTPQSGSCTCVHPRKRHNSEGRTVLIDVHSNFESKKSRFS